MLTPAAVVAVKTLEALGITDRATVQQALILWARPSPRLAPADIRAILATFDWDDGEHYERDDEPAGDELPPHVGGVFAWWPAARRGRAVMSERWHIGYALDALGRERTGLLVAWWLDGQSVSPGGER